jgi:hypothetical protein
VDRLGEPRVTVPARPLLTGGMRVDLGPRWALGAGSPRSQRRNHSFLEASMTTSPTTSKTKPTRPTKRSRARRTSIEPTRARLWRDDHRELKRLCTELQKPEGELVRELVYEALKTRRLRKAGRDEATAPVRDAQREIVRAELADLKNQVKDLLEHQDRMSRMLEDLQEGLAPLIFELLFETWTDGRMTREVVLRYLFLPTFSDAERAGKSEKELFAEWREKAQATSRRKIAEIRQKLAENPFDSQRYANWP